jgi:hypothetical protein
MDPPSPSLPIKIPFSITPSPPLPPPPPQLIGWGVPSWHLLANHRPPLPHPPLEVYCHGRRRRRRVTLVMPSPRCSTPCASLGARRPTRKGGWCRYRRRQRRSQRRGRPPSSGPPCCSHRRQRCCCRRRHRSCRHHHGLRRSCRRRSCRFLILDCQSLQQPATSKTRRFRRARRASTDEAAVRTVTLATAAARRFRNVTATYGQSCVMCIKTGRTKAASFTGVQGTRPPCAADFSSGLTMHRPPQHRRQCGGAASRPQGSSLS